MAARPTYISKHREKGETVYLELNIAISTLAI
jgi:hypothetical protein